MANPNDPRPEMVRSAGQIVPGAYGAGGAVGRYMGKLTDFVYPWGATEASPFTKDNIQIRPGRTREQTYDTFGEEARHRMQMGDGGTGGLGPGDSHPNLKPAEGGGWGRDSELSTMYDQLQGLENPEQWSMTNTAISPAQAMNQRTPGYIEAALPDARQTRINDPDFPILQDISDNMLHTSLTTGISPDVTADFAPAPPGKIENYGNNPYELEAKTGVQKEAYFRKHGHIASPEQFQGWLNEQRKEGGTLHNDTFWSNPEMVDPNSDLHKKMLRTYPKVVDNNNLHQNMIMA